MHIPICLVIVIKQFLYGLSPATVEDGLLIPNLKVELNNEKYHTITNKPGFKVFVKSCVLVFYCYLVGLKVFVVSDYEF